MVHVNIHHPPIYVHPVHGGLFQARYLSVFPDLHCLPRSSAKSDSWLVQSILPGLHILLFWRPQIMPSIILQTCAIYLRSERAGPIFLGTDLWNETNKNHQVTSVINQWHYWHKSSRGFCLLSSDHDVMIQFILYPLNENQSSVWLSSFQFSFQIQQFSMTGFD